MFRAVHFSSHIFNFNLIIYSCVMLIADTAQARDCRRISESPSSQIVPLISVKQFPEANIYRRSHGFTSRTSFHRGYVQDDCHHMPVVFHLSQTYSV